MDDQEPTATQMFHSDTFGRVTRARAEVIDDLVDTMITSIAEKAKACTGCEVASAGFTLCMRIMNAGLSMHVDPEVYRPALEKLWALLPPVKVDG